LRICFHSRHIPIVEGETKNSKYLFFHKGANRAQACAQLGKSMLGVSYSGIMDARNEQGFLHCQHDF
jgi:hypothetical protein